MTHSLPCICDNAQILAAFARQAVTSQPLILKVDMRTVNPPAARCKTLPKITSREWEPRPAIFQYLRDPSPPESAFQLVSDVAGRRRPIPLDLARNAPAARILRFLRANVRLPLQCLEGSRRTGPGRARTRRLRLPSGIPAFPTRAASTSARTARKCKFHTTLPIPGKTGRINREPSTRSCSKKRGEARPRSRSRSSPTASSTGRWPAS